MDFQTIDTPQKAALTPSVMAVSQLWAGDLMEEGPPPAGRFSSANLKMGIAGQPPGFGITYVINADRPNHMNVLGTLGDAVVDEQWDSDPKDGSIHITGHVGSSAESLTISSVDGNWSKFDGTIGNQQVHLALSGPPGHASIAWDGTMGGTPMHEELQFGATGWHFSGAVGASGTDLDVSIKAGPGKEKIVTGTGTVAGVPVDYAQDVAYGDTLA
ncbi:MAG TPA: hypothetical protein VGO93_28935 [Candidatus Xenobia bacterium]